MKIKCDCDALPTDDYRKKIDSCKIDCGDDTNNKCCFGKCVMKNVVVDGKLNLEALALLYQSPNTMNVTAGITHCELLGNIDTSSFSTKLFFCAQFTKSHRFSKFVECHWMSQKSPVVSTGKFFLNVKLKNRNQIVTK